MKFFYLADLCQLETSLDDLGNVKDDPTVPTGVHMDFRGTMKPSPIPKAVMVDLDGQPIRGRDPVPLQVSFKAGDMKADFEVAIPSSNEMDGFIRFEGSRIRIVIHAPSPPFFDIQVPHPAAILNGQFQQIDARLTAYLNEHRSGEYSVPVLDPYNIWASRNRVYDPDMGVLEVTYHGDTVRKYPYLYKPLIFRVLDILVKQFWSALSPHISFSLKWDAYRSFLAEAEEYKEAAHTIARFDTRLRAIYEINIRRFPNGTIDDAKVIDQVAKFLRNEAAFPEEERDQLRWRAERVAAVMAAPPASVHVTRGIKGKNFEREVLSQLNSLGYQTSSTATTGDFGVDIVAERAGIRYALQCKDYTGVVGITAVQEAVAGRKFYKCDFGCVVARVGFTKAAQELASENDIILLPIDRLDRMEALAGVTG